MYFVFNVKKIECVYQEDWLGLQGELEWQDGSGRALFELNAPLAAYIEEGFLTEDEDKFYFFDVDRTLVREVAKEKLGVCWGVGCIVSGEQAEMPEIDLYIFQKRLGHGKKKTVLVLADGETRPLPLREKKNVKVYGYPSWLLVDHGPFEDRTYDYENNPVSTCLSEVKRDFAHFPDKESFCRLLKNEFIVEQ